jgi:hypothetical protein
MASRWVRLLLDHFEVALNSLFIVIVLSVHLFWSPHFDNSWRFTAWTAIVLALVQGCIAYWVRSRQRSVRDQYLKRAENFIEAEVKADARVLLDCLALRSDQPMYEIESARRIVELVDYVSDVHGFLLANPLFARSKI